MHQLGLILRVTTVWFRIHQRHSHNGVIMRTSIKPQTSPKVVECDSLRASLSYSGKIIDHLNPIPYSLFPLAEIFLLHKIFPIPHRYMSHMKLSIFSGPDVHAVKIIFPKLLISHFIFMTNIFG